MIERVRNYGSEYDFDDVSEMVEQSGAFSMPTRACEQRTPSERRSIHNDAWKSVYHVGDRSTRGLDRSALRSTASYELPQVTEEATSSDDEVSIALYAQHY